MMSLPFSGHSQVNHNGLRFEFDHPNNVFGMINWRSEGVHPPRRIYSFAHASSFVASDSRLEAAKDEEKPPHSAESLRDPVGPLPATLLSTAPTESLGGWAEIQVVPYRFYGMLRLMFDVMEQLKTGEHAALFYRSKSEQLAAAIPFIVIGLQRNERCVYIAEDNPVLEILCRLETAGVNIAKAQASGALRVVTKEETYFRHGVFEPQKIVDDFHSEAQLASQEGFTGLRATGEMSWALDLPSSLHRLIEYEQELHTRWPAHLCGLCQYDETRFTAEFSGEMRRLHSIYVRDGKIVRRSPDRDLVAA